MPRNIQLFTRRVSNYQSQVEISGENYCVKNKLCNIFVVNDTKELFSEIRQSWLYNSVTVILC